MEAFLTKLITLLSPLIAKLIVTLGLNRPRSDGSKTALEAIEKAEDVPSPTTQQTVDDLNKGRF